VFCSNLRQAVETRGACAGAQSMTVVGTMPRAARARLAPMASIRFTWLSAVGALLSACFQPTYDRPTCGPNGECPGGLRCNDQNVCAGPGNVPIDSGDPPLGRVEQLPRALA
jgi:hypothetical protein